MRRKNKTCKQHDIMITMRFFPILLLAFTNSFGQEIERYSNRGLDSLIHLPIRFERAWNTRNIDSLGTLFKEDMDYVNPDGAWFRGKAATQSEYKESHSMMFQTGVFTTDSVDIKYVRSDIALMHIGWGISGDFDPDGNPRKPRHGILTWVLIKEKGSWLILSASNVNIRQ
jgi:uncharacterized protein (TIGR02246 family)